MDLKKNLGLVTALMDFILDSESDSSESESDDELSLAVAVYLETRRTDRVNRSERRIKLFVELTVASWDDTEFRSHFRLSRSTVEQLIQILGAKVAFQATRRPMVDLTKQILAVLWLLATPESYRLIFHDVCLFFFF